MYPRCSKASGVAAADVGGSSRVEHTQSMAGNVSKDIVWAVRLMKMYCNPLKELFGFGWSIETVSEAATFSDTQDDGELDVVAVLEEEGQDPASVRVLEDDDLGTAVVFIEG